MSNSEQMNDHDQMELKEASSEVFEKLQSNRLTSNSYVKRDVSCHKKSLGQILIEDNVITEAQLQEVLDNQKNSGELKLGQALVLQKYATEEDVFKALAKQLDLPYYDKLPVNDIDSSLVENIPIQFCKDNLIIPIAKDEFNITVAVADPLNIFPLDDLRLILSTNVNMILSTPTVINNAINRVYEKSSDNSQKAIDELSGEEDYTEDSLEDTRDLLESGDDEKPIIRLVNGLLARAVKERASDIHIEPYETEIVVRFRIDGILYDKMRLPKRHAGSIATRIKIIGKLNIAEKRVPQDGRISIKVAGKDIDVRLSTIPIAHGERLVMRLLDKSAGAKRLDQMGIDPDIYPDFTKIINQKHGIFLVTGPTGSGKTTLLYSALSHINHPDINILTIEDPVEYQLAGVGQVEVKDKIGMTFAAGLRSILRQDPDVIMIGEIRDAETAKIAVQASITGHLVFSTLHTNDTASSVTRLLDFDIQPFQLSSSVLGVVATRLIRKLCPLCKVQYTPSAYEIHQLGIDPKDVSKYKIYKAGAGCERCMGQGYIDRMGVYELLVFDDEMRETILKTQDATAIKKVAVRKGMVTLREAALKDVLKGLTSIEEAVRKTQTDDLDLG